VFRHADQPLPDAPLYLMPSVRGGRNPTARRWRDLLERVRAGATLYVSLDDARISGFAGIFGMELRTRCQRTRPAVLDLAGVEGAGEMAVASDIRMDLSEAGAEVLAREADGNPALTCHRYGKGRVYLLTVPVERRLAETPGAFDADAAPWWRLYRHVAAKQVRRRAVRTEHPAIGLTEHRLDAKSRVVVAINYGPTPMRGELTLSRGWRVAESWLGAAPAETDGQAEAVIGGNDGIILVVRKA
jgi:hypothetical protein